MKDVHLTCRLSGYVKNGTLGQEATSQNKRKSFASNAAIYKENILKIFLQRLMKSSMEE